MKGLFTLFMLVFLTAQVFMEWSLQSVYAKGKEKKPVQEDNPLIRMCREYESDEFIQTYIYEFEKKRRKDCLVLEQDCRQSCYSALRLYPDMKEPESLFEGITTEMDAQNIKARLKNFRTKTLEFLDVNGDGMREIVYDVYWETPDRMSFERQFFFHVNQGKLAMIWDIFTITTDMGGSYEYKYDFLDTKHDGAKDIKVWKENIMGSYDKAQYFRYSKKEGRYIEKNK